MKGPLWTSFVAIFRKEFIHIVRDRSTLVMALTVPLFQLILFGFIDQSVKNVPTVVVDLDRSVESRDFLDRIESTRTFKIVKSAADDESARAEIRAAHAKVGLLIPPDFHDKRVRGEPAEIAVLIDGSDSSVSSQALGAVNGLAAQMSFDEIKKIAPIGKPRFDVRPVILFNPEGRTANFIIPGLVAVILQLVAIVLTALAIVREREKGTLEQLLVTPIHPMGLMLGKLAPYLVLGCFEASLILFAMRFGFDVPIRGNLLFLAVMMVIYLFSLLSMGLLVSTRATSQAQAMQSAQMIFLPSIFLSGYIFPASGLPLPLYLIGRFLPATHMLEIMRGIVLRDAGPRELWVNVLALIAMGIFLVWLSARRFQKVAL